MAATAMALLEESRLTQALTFNADIAMGVFVWSIMLASIAMWGATLRELVPLAIRPETATVEMSETGIRHAEGRWLPWTQVKSVRPRRIWKRLDVEGLPAEPTVQLHYQSEDFALALQTILANVPAPPARSAPSISLAADRLMFLLAAIAVGVGVWLTSDFILGGVILVGLPFGYWLDTKDKVKTLIIDAERLDVTFAHRRLLLQRRDVEDIQLVLGAAPWINLTTRDRGIVLQLPASELIAVYLMIAERWRIGARRA